MAGSPFSASTSPATPSKPSTSSASFTPINAKRKHTTLTPSDASDDDNTPTPTKKVKSTATSTPRKPRRSVKPLPLAKTYDLCDAHDKMLIDMRDAGRSWDEIRKAWENVTGDATATSTLPNRYSRLKSHFVIIKEEDNAKLLEAKHDVDMEFEREKWGRVVERMVAKGAERYTTDEVKRQYVKLMLFSQELKKGAEEGEGIVEMEE